ncbi:MAG: hypothetical protein M3Q07_27300, partial [Pseudobdellovibrionaceae bacterium]|nr:hypothetical protein [Pseudobdellovibrionaceae bacterium]
LYTEPSEDDSQDYPRFIPHYDTTVDEALIVARTRNRNGYALKIAPNGAVPFYQDSQSTHAETWNSIKALKDGGSVLAGASASPVIIKLDTKGTVVWSYFYKLGGVYSIGSITESVTDGSLVVGGQIYTADDANEDMFVMKLTAQGDLVWAKRLKGPYNTDMIHTVEILNDQSIAIGGSYGITTGMTGIDPIDNTQAQMGWVALLDTQGNVLRSKLYSSQAVIDIAAVNGGADGLMLAGFTDRTVSGNLVRVPWVMRIQADGSVAWRQGLLEHVRPQSLAVGMDGILLAGIRNFTFSDARVNHDGWLAQLSMSGNVLWARTFGSAKEDGLLYASQAANGRILAGGYHIPAARTVKPWLLNLSASGDGTFRDSSGFTSSNNSASLFTPPLSYTDAPLTSQDVSPVRENWDRTLKPGSIAVEDIAGP